ncbi:hypothetical protein AB1K70_10715 [Bremerella sp. JC770]|uniref:hypothetical protein n=1 Tax=Bremerella sp. JC770 TaxID=3232137 RepID=UPI003459E850
MNPESLNPFDSPATYTASSEIRCHAGLSSVLGRLVASGICLAAGLANAAAWIRDYQRPIKASDDSTSATVAVFLLILSVAFLLFAVVTRRRCGISIDANRICGQCTLKSRTVFRELLWSELSGWKIEDKHYLVLTDENGDSFDFYIGWYYQRDRLRIVELCHQHLGAPGTSWDSI